MRRKGDCFIQGYSGLVPLPFMFYSKRMASLRKSIYIFYPMENHCKRLLQSAEFLTGPEIFPRGFIFEREYEHIIEEVRERVESVNA